MKRVVFCDFDGFARDHLAQDLDDAGRTYLPWQDFFDIRHTLAQS
jgi:2-hydroxy-3-keto-5-methylthiopentenyl-1-phosphate phosphatase